MRLRYPGNTVMLLAVAALLNPLVSNADPTHRTCATASPTAATMSAVRARVGTMAGLQGVQSGGVINVAFHVIHSGSLGEVPQSQIDAQIQVLNQDYAPHGYQFQLVVVDHPDNASWYTMTTQAKEDAAKNALAVDPAHTLNIYTANLGGSYLGWSYYPWDFPETSKEHAVFLDFRSLPGGTFVPYDLGRTATHEVGHWVGLAHTFENGCTAPGDEVDDTPYESDPAFGCPIGSDTCPAAGVDPIHNYMDYSDDACMTEFSPGQGSRVNTMIALYRPSLLSGGPTLVHHGSWGALKVRYSGN